MRTAFLVVSLMRAGSLSAQWDVPVRMELNGAQPADKQVLGLADPATTSAAVSVDAARNNVVSFATVTGSAILTGSLSPAPATWMAGTIVNIVPTEANDAGAQLDLNALGPLAMVKGGGLPLDSADLLPGAPVRLVFDG
ncbi:MAG TPA: hypothetical protein PK760_10630, partial [Flavobacteriales bacterium]|nr:hypothetical protein [Flavobacteriales bacterium]